MKLKKQKSDSEEAVKAPQNEEMEVDQFKRTYFGPDIPTLELDCWEEELSEAQLKAFRTADDEYKSIQNKLDAIVKDTGGEIVYNGDQFTAYQLLGKQPVLKDLERESADIIRSRSRSLSVSKENLRVSKRGRVIRSKRQEEKEPSPSPEPAPSPTPETRQKKKHKKEVRKEKEEKKEKEKEKVKESSKAKEKPSGASGVPDVHSVVTNVRPSEATAIGGLSTGSNNKNTTVVDLTKEDGNKNIADSREISFNKLQGKTYPSLVVVARPYLKSKDVSTPADRSTLDSKVKSVLMHTPTKFTEWLIQQGLVRSEQWCSIHPGNKLKLGMYSDVSKFPYSGGYVWISECCPTRFVSVFSNSVFEGATHPPSVILKLVYHWACQTNVQNVVQWVKVDNLYVKGLFTWLRAVCTSAIHQNLGILGGPGKKVEVGVISLGTTSHDGTQRQVKVEVLGVLDTTDKLIRLRAVEPLADYEKNYKKRFQKILEPLSGWVHQSSIILTDLTVDKGTLLSMGFKTVYQSSSHSMEPSKNSNANIMEYLRRIVPRMFQNTLSLLSRQIIQQFLDELVWREKFGVMPGQAFDNIVIHLAEQTRLDSKDSIVSRLNRIAANPFKNWKHVPKKKLVDSTPAPLLQEDLGRGKRGRKKKELSPSPPPAPTKKTAKETRAKKPVVYADDDDEEELPLATRRTKIKQEKEKPPEKEQRLSERRRKRDKSYVIEDDDETDDVPLKVIKKEVKQEQETVSMERYYFGQVGGTHAPKKQAIAVECVECHMEVNNNCELMRHIYAHIVPGPDQVSQCIYCLMRFGNDKDLQVHLKHMHPRDTKSPDLFTYACLICEVRFAAVLTLANHMQKTHSPLELPYLCGVCDYRSSSHRVTIDHFYNSHGNDNYVQCPHCLKVTTIYADGYDLQPNTYHFMEHLQLHQDKEQEMKCNRCALKFVHLGMMKDHQIREHNSLDEANSLCNEEHLIVKPKIKPRPPVKDSTNHTVGDLYDDILLEIPEGMICKECDFHLESDRHFIATMTCTKCPYTTSCNRAMLQHSGYCAGPHSLEDAPRDAPYATYCVCGYFTKIGTDMLTHLLECEHKTAYTSAAEAKENSVGWSEAMQADSQKLIDETSQPASDTTMEAMSSIPDYAPPSVLNTQLSLDDLAPPSILQTDQEPELLKETYEGPLATPRHEIPPAEQYSLGDFEPLPQEPPPQPDFEQL